MHFFGGGDERTAHPHRRADARFDALGVTWLLLVVVWLTLAPFSPRSGEVEFRLVPGPALHDIVGNALLFAPLGVVFGARLRGRRLLASLFAVLAVSICIELAQFRVAGRVVSPCDVLLNGAGAALAAALAGRAVRRGLPPTTMTRTVVALVFLGAVVYLTGTTIAVRRGMRLEGWDPEYAVVAGDEPDGTRPYQGDVFEARICAPDGSCARPGAAPAERRALVDAAMELQHVTLSANVVSRTDSQAGPTRIVTFSAGADRRNATLAQEGRSLILRLRTGLGGENGVGLQLALPEGVHAGEPARVVGSYDRGTLGLSAHSADEAYSVRYRPTLLDAWFALRRPGVVVERDVAIARVVAGLVLLLPLALVVVGTRSGHASESSDMGVAHAPH